MFFAMLLHKWSEALSVGASLLKSNVSKNRAIALILFFTVISCIGFFVADTIDSVIAKSVLNSLSAGTFIYIAFCEILNEEFSHGIKRKYTKFLLLILGIGIVCLANRFHPENCGHNHGHGGHAKGDGKCAKDNKKCCNDNHDHGGHAKGNGKCAKDNKKFYNDNHDHGSQHVENVENSVHESPKAYSHKHEDKEIDCGHG